MDQKTNRKTWCCDALWKHIEEHGFDNLPVSERAGEKPGFLFCNFCNQMIGVRSISIEEYLKRFQETIDKEKAES